MRRIFLLLCAVLLIGSLAATVFAVSAPNMSSNIELFSDGHCEVDMSLTLRVEEANQEIFFPLPEDARNIIVEEYEPVTIKEDGVLKVALHYHMEDKTGDVTLHIQYEVPSLIHETDLDELELQLPLLSGFEYPISNLSFTVTLPDDIKGQPAFSSGYHQSSIEQQLSYSISGDTLSCSALKAIKDHETLVMTLPVTEEMFPPVIVETTSTLSAQVGMLICAAAALLLWVLTLRFLPKPQRCSDIPIGISAGQVGCAIGNKGLDLTMAVFTWAQLGYLIIQPGKQGRVFLHKRIEMGNERDEYERRAYERLFNNRKTVDATGSRYAALAGAFAGRRTGVNGLFRRFSGKPLFFRLACITIGGFGGGGMGAVIGGDTSAQTLLTVIFGILGGVSAWVILDWTDGGLYRRKGKAVAGWLIAAGWVALGLIIGRPTFGMVMALILLVYGVLYGYSGLRTPQGKQTACQLLGLRRYLQGKELDALDRACDKDPEYFFRMFPYAMALGVGHAFAKAVCDEKMDYCPYMAYDASEPMDALEWYELMLRIVNTMDNRRQNPFIEGLGYYFRRTSR